MVDLRRELSSRNLSTTGLKKALAKRLKKFIQAEPLSSQQNPDSKDHIQSSSSNDEGGREDSGIGCKKSNAFELYSSSGMCTGLSYVRNLAGARAVEGLGLGLLNGVNVGRDYRRN